MPSDPSSSEPELQRPRRAALIEWGTATAVYTLLAALFTWPLIGRMSTGMYGFGADNWAGPWIQHWIHEAFWSDRALAFTNDLQAPFGQNIDERFIQPLDRLFAIVFGGIGGGTFAFNLQIFVSFILGGLAMYALARYISGSRWAAGLAGIIFAFSPFHVAMAMQYHALSSTQAVPLLVLAVLVALRKRTLKSALLAGAALALVWYSSYYHGWFAVWFLLVLLLAAAAAGAVRALRARRLRQATREAAGFTVTRVGLAIGAFALLTVPAVASIAFKVAADPGAYERASDDLYNNAVKPWMLVLPPHDNPIIGSISRDFINSHLGILPIYEQSVYLGLVPVLLALLGVIFAGRVGAAATYARPLLVAGGLFTIVIMLGPALPRDPFSVDAWMAPGNVPHVTNFSKVMFDLSGAFRYYGRAFALVSVCLAGLAAVGFAAFEPRLRRIGWWAPPLAAIALTGLVFVEFLNRPPTRWLDLTDRSWATAVEKLPDDAEIVDYPLAGWNTPRSLYYTYWQARHGHATLNPPLDPRAEKLAAVAADPNDPSAGEALQRAGIDYAVIHTRLPAATFPPYQPPFPDDSLPASTGASNPWFRLVRRAQDANIYAVRRPEQIRSDVFAGYGTGFGQPETGTEPGREWRWALDGKGAIRVTVTGTRPRLAVLRFGALSFDKPRDMRLVLDGRTVRRVRVPSKSPRDIVLAQRLEPGTHEIALETDPGPQVIAEVQGGTDGRAVTVRISKPEVIRGGYLDFGRGFHEPEELAPGQQWRWMRGGTATLRARVLSDGVRRTRLTFSVASLGPPSRMRVAIDGRELTRRRVSPTRVDQVVLTPRLARGRHAVTIRVQPEPRSIDSVVGNGDQRRVTIRVGALDFAVVPGR